MVYVGEFDQWVPAIAYKQDKKGLETILKLMIGKENKKGNKILFQIKCK